MSQRIAEWSLSHTRALVGVATALTLAGLLLLPALRIENGLDVFSEKSSPLRRQLDALNSHFVSDTLIFVAYEAADPFSPPALGAVRALGVAIEAIELPGANGVGLFPVDKVTSLATVDDLVGSELSFRTQPLIPDPIPDDPAVLAEARGRALRNPVLRGNLLSEDGRAAAILVRLTPGLDDDQRAATVAGVRAATDAHAGGPSELCFHVAGDSVTTSDIAIYQARDLGKFIPLSYALITVLLFAFLRRVRGLVLALVAVTASLVISTGVLTAIGSSINNCSVMLPPVMVCLTVAMLLHYLSELSKNAAVVPVADLPRVTLGELLAPVFLAALTTAIGFAALGVSRVPAVRDFGFTAGISMLLGFVVTSVLFVVAVRRFGASAIISPQAFATSPRFALVLERLAALVSRRRWLVLVACAGFTALMVGGAGQIVVDNDDLAMFSETAPVRVAATFVDQRLGGSVTVLVSARADAPERFLEPEALQQLADLKRFCEGELGAGQVTSAVDFVRLMHREFFNGDPARLTIPETAEQVAQLLMLNGDESLDEYLDQERRWARLVARFDVHSSTELDRLFRRLDGYLDANFADGGGIEVYATGQSRVGAEMVNKLIHSQALGLGVACLLIFGLMFLVFRSLSAGLVSLVPNLFPIVTNLGLMGWLGVRLDASTVMISTVALGIAVDDTVHFVQHVRSRLAHHGDLDQAVRDAFRVKGPAIVGTSLVISLGFCVVLASSFAPTRNFGLLIAVAMVAALIGDLLVLPATILGLRPRLGVRRRPREP